MTTIHKYTHTHTHTHIYTHTHTTVCIYVYMYVSMCASDTCVNVSMHQYICSHTHVPHIHFHCNTGGVAPTCTYTACGVSGATNTSGGHNKYGWSIYNNRRSNTSKGWDFPKKSAPPYPTHHTGSAGHLDWTVQSQRSEQ